MRPSPLFLGLLLVAVREVNAKPTQFSDIPWKFNVSEVSKDGHVIHNRLTFDCQAAEGSDPYRPKEINCVMIQQNLREPSAPPPRQEDLDKEAAKLSSADLKKACEEALAPKLKSGSHDDAGFSEKVGKACAANDRASIVAALAGWFREQADREGQTCSMTTIARRGTFRHIKPGVWVTVPDSFNACPNVKITGTLIHDDVSWNLTEVVVATPSTNSLCQAESGTTEFTWRVAVTPTPLKCRFVQM